MSRTRRVRIAAMIGTVAALLGLLASIPKDSCGASMSGACVLYDVPLFQSQAALKDKVELAFGTVSVERVTAARTLVRGSETDQVGDGFIVAVRIWGDPTPNARTVAPVLVVDGYEFTPASKGSLSLKPGFPAEVLAVFTVPDTLAGKEAAVRVSWTGQTRRGVVVPVGPLNPVARHTEPA